GGGGASAGPASVAPGRCGPPSPCRRVAYGSRAATTFHTGPSDGRPVAESDEGNPSTADVPGVRKISPDSFSPAPGIVQRNRGFLGAPRARPGRLVSKVVGNPGARRPRGSDDRRVAERVGPLLGPGRRRRPPASRSL